MIDISNPISIGDNLRNERKRQGITQEQLAEMSNLSLNFISKIERKEKQNISINTLMSLASALHISSSELLKGSSEIKSNRRKRVDQLTRQLYKLPEKEAEQLSTAFLQVVKATKGNKE